MGLLLVLSAPSGTGKTTVAGRLLDRHGGPAGSLARSVSVTTRTPRPGEVDGIDYFFVTEERFAALATRKELLEQAELYGHRYGTPRQFVESCLRRGVDVLLILNARGREQVAATYGADLVSVFLLPPNWQELETRLRGRAGADEQTVARRLEAARSEAARCDQYDHVLVNRDIDLTLQSLKTIFHEERLCRDGPLHPIDRFATTHGAGS